MRREGKRATGIEPAWPAWKAGTLPLSYARNGKENAPLQRPCQGFLFCSLLANFVSRH